MINIDSAKEPVLIMEGECITQFNTAAARVLLLDDPSMLQQCHPAEISPEYQPDGSSSHASATKYIASCYRLGGVRFHWVHRNRAGEDFPVEVTLLDISSAEQPRLLSKWRMMDDFSHFQSDQLPSGQHDSGHVVPLDVVAAEQGVEFDQQKVYRLLNEHKKAIDCSVIVSKTDTSGTITYVNDKFCDISGYTRSELLGQSHNIVNHPDMPRSVFGSMWKTIKHGDIWQGVIKNRKKDGDYYYVNTTISPIRNDSEQITEYIAIRSDITEVFDKDDVIHFLSTDPVTGAFNRSKLDSDLLGSGANCLALIKIPELVDILTIYKYATYNEVLSIAADFIRQYFNSAYVFYRVNERTFAVLTRDEHLLKDMEQRCRQLVADFQNALIETAENDFSMTMQIGISGSSDMDSVYSGASIALQTCERSSEKLVIYSPENPMYQLLKQTNEWALKIKTALQSDSVAIFGQSIVGAERELVSTEVLMRYYDLASDSYVSPFYFLEHVHRAGIYHQLSLAVIKKAVSYYADKAQRFSINLCFSDIENSAFSQQILDAIAQAGVGDRLTIELVESENYDMNHRALTTFLSSLKALGCKIAIDDFGSGYSNFEYLSTLPIDLLKIDGSLIRNIAEDRKHYLVVKSLISFCRAIDVKIVAEFVKDEEVYHLLKDLGVDYFQGFYFHQPQLLAK
ncbi:MAG: bifunctional diguanylate cyclase/phosphodiesterase [Pseudomonadales bacterium]